MNNKLVLAGSLALALASFSSQAAEVFDTAVVPAVPFNWASGADDTYGTSDDMYAQWGQIDLKNGATVTVTGDFAKDGNGSMRLASNGGTGTKGGAAYYPETAAGFGALKSITAASFEWLRATGSDATDGSPVMRLFLFNASNAHTATLIWQGGPNGAATTNDAWQTADVFGGTVSQTRGAGPLYNVEMTFAAAQLDPQLADLVVRAVEVGFGSGGWGPNFVGAVDNVKLTGGVSAVDANFELANFNVTIDAGANGTAVPGNGVENLMADETLAIALTPADGYEIDQVTGCDGALSGTTYTTGAAKADCTVTASFKAIALTVPPVAPVAPAEALPVPTLSQWSLALMGLLTAGIAALRLRRRN